MMISAESAPQGGASFETMRHAMVASQLRTSGVNDARVVEAMARVPRERYIPEAVRGVAYRDGVLPIGGGRGQNSPLATGRLLTEANLRSDDHVLLVGAAGGYTAAVLAEIVASVVALEIDPTLVSLAREALGDAPKVTVAEGPLTAGWPEAAPYSLLVIDGAVAQVPLALIDQLRAPARIVSGLVDRGVTRLAAGRRSEGGFGLVDFADCECAILPGFEPPATFRF